MNVRLITEEEIIERQQAVRSSFQQSQEAISVSGMRQTMGSALIALGHRIHGKLEDRRETLARPKPLTSTRGA